MLSIQVEFSAVGAIYQMLYIDPLPFFTVASTGRGSCQLIQKSLRFLKVPGVESFCEPIINGCEQFSGLLVAALSLPKACEARRGTKLIGFRALAPGDLEDIT